MAFARLRLKKASSTFSNKEKAMPRTSTEITPQEIQAYNEFCQHHSIVNNDSQEGVKNGKHIGEYIAVTWGEDINPGTLAVALERLGDKLVFKSAIQVELEQVVSKLNDQERKIAYNWFKRQRLVSDGDLGSQNVSNIIGWLQKNNHQISDQTLNLALTNIVNRGTRPLHWKPAPLQGSEKEAKSQKEASSASDRQDRAEAVPTHPQLALRPELAYHREMLHRPSETVKAARPDSDAEWRARAESVLTNSHVDNAHVKKLFITNPDGQINWPETLRARERFVERRKHERQNAGR
jgi:hypothetical protein